MATNIAINVHESGLLVTTLSRVSCFDGLLRFGSPAPGVNRLITVNANIPRRDRWRELPARWARDNDAAFGGVESLVLKGGQNDSLPPQPHLRRLSRRHQTRLRLHPIA